jgi:hypothetical protein
MIRRVLTNQSCALKPSTFSRSFSRSLPTRSSFSRSRLELSRRTIHPSSFRPLSPRLSQRWQSTETEKKAEDSSPPPAESKPAEAQEADPLKNELETKNREIIELKVCRIGLAPQSRLDPHPNTLAMPECMLTLPPFPGQIPPLRRRIPQPPRANKTRH